MNDRGNRSVRERESGRARLAERRRRALVRLIAGAEPPALERYFRRLAEIDGRGAEAFSRAS
ncbi:MAG TPA: hypothetical protein VGD01_07015 [Candidatus Elarobacter sp.]|jgi:hypothetical protein